MLRSTRLQLLRCPGQGGQSARTGQRESSRVCSPPTPLWVSAAGVRVKRVLLPAIAFGRASIPQGLAFSDVLVPNARSVLSIPPTPRFKARSGGHGRGRGGNETSLFPLEPAAPPPTALQPDILPSRSLNEGWMKGVHSDTNLHTLDELRRTVRGAMWGGWLGKRFFTWGSERSLASRSAPPFSPGPPDSGTQQRTPAKPVGKS